MRQRLIALASRRFDGRRLTRRAAIASPALGSFTWFCHHAHQQDRTAIACARAELAQRRS